MKVLFATQAWEDYTWWLERDPKTLRRVNRMIEEASRAPGEGIGKPERLAGNFSGYWSRRVTQEHRLVYRVDGETVVVVQARYHY